MALAHGDFRDGRRDREQGCGTEGCEDYEAPEDGE